MLPAIKTYIFQPNCLTEANYHCTLIQERLINAVIFGLQEAIQKRMHGENYIQLSLFEPRNLPFLSIEIQLSEIATPAQYRFVKEAIKKLASIVVELRYRKNNTGIFGKPDFTFRRQKVAVFCDSEFFHGMDWETNKYRIKTNVSFWHIKIEGNISRDKLVNETLLKDGWKVIRFWGLEIKKNTDFCIQCIKNEIETRNNEILGSKGKTKYPA